MIIVLSNAQKVTDKKSKHIYKLFEPARNTRGFFNLIIILMAIIGCSIIKKVTVKRVYD